MHEFVLFCLTSTAPKVRIDTLSEINLQGFSHFLLIAIFFSVVEKELPNHVNDLLTFTFTSTYALNCLKYTSLELKRFHCPLIFRFSE